MLNKPEYRELAARLVDQIKLQVEQDLRKYEGHPPWHHDTIAEFVASQVDEVADDLRERLTLIASER